MGLRGYSAVPSKDSATMHINSAVPSKDSAAMSTNSAVPIKDSAAMRGNSAVPSKDSAHSPKITRMQHISAGFQHL